MLVLSRKVGEQIIINGDIRITVLKSVGQRIRLGIDAPKEISIQRAELELCYDHRKESDESTETKLSSTTIS